MSVTIDKELKVIGQFSFADFGKKYTFKNLIITCLTITLISI